MDGWVVAAIALAYVAFLFALAWIGDRRRGGRAGDRPVTYALSLAIYCTSWTFFGSVGLAATSGLDFLGIYLGPVLAVTLAAPLWWRIVRTAKDERVTSVADYLAARYGKSTGVGAMAVLIALVGTVPYIALQLKAVSTSVATMVAYYLPAGSETALSSPLLAAGLLALFACLFGTRHADATEHQDGLILAVATESVVKLVAFLALGVWVVGSVLGGWSGLTAAVSAREAALAFDAERLVVFTALSFLAFLFLPRQFHVGVVENRSQRELRRARWAFPLYLVAINLFVVPVALGGLATFDGTVNPDAFVLALPLQRGADGLAALVFLGGLSAATAMVIVASVALAIMVSNNLVLPLVLSRDARVERARGDRTQLVLATRRLAIVATLALAFAYVNAAGDAALAAIGLVSFAAIAQFAPAFLIGLFWRRGTARGAVWGMGVGFAVWCWTLLLPTLLDADAALLADGPFGLAALRPQALLGVDAAPLTHGVLWSLGLNLLAYVAVSLSRKPNPLERMQAETFTGAVAAGSGEPGEIRITRGQLEAAAARYLGRERTRRSFEAHFAREGYRLDWGERADARLVRAAERLLASAVGAASARLVVALALDRHRPGTGAATVRLLDEASEAVLYNRDLLATALDRVDQGIAVFDADGLLNTWNRRFRELSGLSEAYGQVGTPLGRMAEAIARTVTGDDVVMALAERRPAFSFESGRRIVEAETRPMADGGLVVVLQDATERRRAAEALRDANTDLERRVAERTAELTRLNGDLEAARERADAALVAKTRFLAAAGHDILQPLNAARLYAAALVERREEGAELAGNIDRSLGSVEEILDAVLTVSRLEAAAPPPAPAPLAMATLFERLETEFAPAAQEKGLALTFESSPLHVLTDAGLVARLLRNLVSNAVKYTAEGGVTVRAHAEGDVVVCEVEDTGLGIPDDARALVFREFERLEAGRKAADGLGLGLSIVARIAGVLGHAVTFDAREGGGTVFTLRMPRAEAASAPAARTEGPSAQRLDLRILVIDNDASILDGMRTLLEGWGATVATARSGADALDRVRDGAEVALIDYHLEDETGLDVAARLRTFDASLAVALVTAERGAWLKDEAGALDIAVLHKPVRPARLRAWLSAARPADRPAMREAAE